MPLDLEFVRSRFPALNTDEVFFDNAGGSLVLDSVADRVRDYLLTTSVQLGATYPAATTAAERYASARGCIADYLGAARPEEIVFGPSSTILLRILADAHRDLIGAGDEIVVTSLDHEANITPWLELAERTGATIRFLEPVDGALCLEALARLLNDRTKLVALTHVSNILGTIHDVSAAAELVHRAGARVCVDGVAFAPHRQLAVQDWNVDFYVFSLYKVYGPHHAVLYGKHEALRELAVVNHGFFDREQVPGKLEPGNANYELSHGATAIAEYMTELGQRIDPTAEGRDAHALAFAAIAEHEERLAHRLLEYLTQRSDITVVGIADGDGRRRVPTISFVHESRLSSAIVAAIDEHRIGIRFGHFYAARYVDHLDIADRDGVVRVSMVHYNTLAEVERLIAALDITLK